MKKEVNVLINTLLLDCKKLMMERQTGMKAKTELFEAIKAHSPKPKAVFLYTKRA